MVSHPGTKETVVSRPAWTAPTIEEILPTVHRIPLPLPMDGLRAVNVYAIHDGNGVTLVDGGWDVPEAEVRLRAAFAELGLRFSDISEVLATHFHRDHYTLAVRLRELTGCQVGLGAGERDSVTALLSGQNAVPGLRRALRRAGVPVEQADPVAIGGDATTADHYALPDRWLTDREVIPAGAHQLETIATPGHTRGHVCFAATNDRLLFAGDHVLPHITPSIGFETRQAHLPLADYLASLATVRSRTDARLLPAHGPTGPSVHERIDELLAHHDVRLTRCLAAVDGGAHTAFEVANVLRWTRHERRWTELSNFDRVLAAHETLAHLDVLVAQNRLGRTDAAGTSVFALPDVRSTDRS
jgi:glyoxylase-like metal-dependent hydrolase (beta-lactamase superfamily II)